MKRQLTFFLLCEGTSDEALVGHLESLVARHGVDEVIGIARSGGGSVDQKLRTLQEDGTPFDFVAVHRDADGRDPSPRVAEVNEALERIGLRGFPVVPVQMTEAWLLLDEGAIREVVGRPTGREPIDLPSVRTVEATHDPKSVLKAALLAAAGATGRRRKRVAREWSTHRRILLERLDVESAVQDLPSWQRLVADVAQVVSAVLPSATSEDRDDVPSSEPEPRPAVG